MNVILSNEHVRRHKDGKSRGSCIFQFAVHIAHKYRVCVIEYGNQCTFTVCSVLSFGHFKKGVCTSR
jgi:hypothetical protein